MFNQLALLMRHWYVIANVPLVGTFAVNPVVLKAVTKGVPVDAALAKGVNEQLEGVADIGVENVTGCVVEEVIVTPPARTGLADPHGDSPNELVVPTLSVNELKQFPAETV